MHLHIRTRHYDLPLCRAVKLARLLLKGQRNVAKFLYGRQGTL